MNKKVAISLAISSVLTLGASQKAFALDFQSLLRSYVDNKLTGGSNTTTQMAVKTNINNRQAQLEQEIEAGVNTGQITPAEESDLRNDLVQIAHQESTNLQDGVLQDAEVIQLLTQMNALSSKIQSYLTNGTTTGTGNLSHQEWFRKFGSKPSDSSDRHALPNARLRKARIDSMQAELDSKIQEAVTSGSLSWAQSRTYLNDLNKIKTDEMNYLRDGFIDYTEEQNLLNALNTLTSKVDSNNGSRRHGRRHNRRHNNWHTASKAHQPILHQRIANKLNAGKISRHEANALYRQENEVHALEQRLRSNTNLTFEQERTLFNKLSQLTKSIEEKLTGY